MLFRQNDIPGNLNFESNNGANDGGSTDSTTSTDSTSGEVVSKAEYEKIKQSLENERNANRRLAQDKQELKQKADDLEKVKAIYSQFTANPSPELAEQVLGVAPGTLTKGMTKAEKKETEPDEMSDDTRVAVEAAKKIIAEERSVLKKEIDELKRLRDEDLKKGNQKDYATEFQRVLEKEFPLESLEKQYGDNAPKIQRSLARNLHTLMLTGQFKWPEAVSEIKNELSIFASSAQKTQVAEAKKVAEQHSKSQSSGSQPAIVTTPGNEGKPQGMTMKALKAQYARNKQLFAENLQKSLVNNSQEG